MSSDAYTDVESAKDQPQAESAEDQVTRLQISYNNDVENVNRGEA